MLGMHCVIYLNDNSQPWALQWAEAMDSGLRAHGETVERRQIDDLVDSDLAIIWGHGKPGVIAHQRAIESHYLVMERGYIGDRMKFTSLGFDGLNGRAAFGHGGNPSDRWEKHGFKMQPWKRGGDYVLIMGQVPGDQSIQHIDIRAVLSAAASEASDATGLPVYYRPHPLAHESWIPAPALYGTLADAIAGAERVITINSNSGVDSVLAGVSTVTLDRGSMAWDVTSHNVSEPLCYTDRDQWAYDLAYCQWTEDEIQSGEAWEHVRHAIR
jgi:hypothetical protein